MVKWNKNSLSALFKVLGQNSHSVDDVGRLLANYGDDVALSLAKTPAENVENFTDLAKTLRSGIYSTQVKQFTGKAPKIISSNPIPNLIAKEAPTTRYLGNVRIFPSKYSEIFNEQLPGNFAGHPESYSRIPSIKVPNIPTKDLVIDHIQTGVKKLQPDNSYYTDRILRPHNNTALGRWFRKKMGTSPTTLQNEYSLYPGQILDQEIDFNTYWNDRKFFDSLHDEPIQTMFEKLYTPKKRMPKFSPSDIPDDFLTIVGDD